MCLAIMAGGGSLESVFGFLPSSFFFGKTSDCYLACLERDESKYGVLLMRVLGNMWET